MLPALDHFRKHPLMYVGIGIPDVQVYLNGLTHAFSLAYPDLNFQAMYEQVLKERGWLHSTRPAWVVMEEQGLAPDVIRQTLLDLHYETWKRLANLSQPETTTPGGGVRK
jgi:hypothetical protein